MANFTAAFTSGAMLEAWTDPATASAPGRLNPSEGLSHKRYKATVGVQVVITTTQNGVVAPLDSGLSGFVFKPWHLETPDGSPPGWSNPAGQSYRARVPRPAGRPRGADHGPPRLPHA